MGRTMRSLAWVVAVTAAVVALVRARRRRVVERVIQTGDVVPGSAEHREALVDDAIDDSFPASDAPSYWGRETPP